MEYEHRIKTLQDKIDELELSAALLFYSRDVLYFAYSGANRHPIPIEIATLFRSKSPRHSEANRHPC